ncbi:MAG: ATP-dependent transcriptional regulator, partial [Pseudomonadota bacterium]
RVWIDEMNQALGSTRAPGGRRAAAERAIAISQSAGWMDARQGFSLYALGRLTIASDPDIALRAFQNADRVYAAHPETRVHRAYVAVQLAAFQLLQGNADGVLTLVSEHINTAFKHENAALLASLLMFRAEALELQGRVSEARVVRVDSLGWARYGYGSSSAIKAREREISQLNPAKRRTAGL